MSSCWISVWPADGRMAAMIPRATKATSSASGAGPISDVDCSLPPPNLFNIDPPRHDELRSVLSRALTPSRIAGLEPHVRAFAQEQVDGWRDRGRADISTEYAQLIPTMTM